jgi:hypothetical protein
LLNVRLDEGSRHQKQKEKDEEQINVEDDNNKFVLTDRKKFIKKRELRLKVYENSENQQSESGKHEF